MYTADREKYSRKAILEQHAIPPPPPPPVKEPLYEAGLLESDYKYIKPHSTINDTKDFYLRVPDTKRVIEGRTSTQLIKTNESPYTLQGRVTKTFTVTGHRKDMPEKTVRGSLGDDDDGDDGVVKYSGADDEEEDVDTDLRSESGTEDEEDIDGEAGSSSGESGSEDGSGEEISDDADGEIHHSDTPERRCPPPKTVRVSSERPRERSERKEKIKSHNCPGKDTCLDCFLLSQASNSQKTKKTRA